MKKKILLIQFLFCASLLSRANNYYVTTASDTGAGSLRVMMDSANANPGLDTITLSLTAHDTIYLGTALTASTDSLLITGLPCQNPTISGDSIGFSTPAIFSSDSTKPLTINYLNIFNCKTMHAGAYGAVYAGQLYINNCYFYNNSHVQNGGNVAAGAACGGIIWAYNSTFGNNSCSALPGGAGALYGAGIHLFNCTFVNNFSFAYGGAVNGNISEIQNCTFSGNHANTGGGAIYSSFSPANFVIANNIIWGNTITDSSGNHVAGVELISSNISGGCNILQDAVGADSIKPALTDVTGTDPQFGTLGYYSGCVPVLPILCGSVAENHATCSGATTADAEGIVAQGVRDAGAFEITHPHLGGDTIDSIARGATANLYNYFNVTGLTVLWPGGLTDSTAAAVDTGTYTVIGTNFLGCSDTATATVVYNNDTLTGIKSPPGINAMQLYPNPAKDQVNITWSAQKSGVFVLKLVDMLGMVVMTQNVGNCAGKIVLNTAQLSSGTYCLSLVGNDVNTATAKLVVLPR